MKKMVYSVTFAHNDIYNGAIFKKKFDDVKVSLEELIKLNKEKQCNYIFIEFEKNISHFKRVEIGIDTTDGSRDKIASLSYYFTVEPLVELISSEEIVQDMPNYIRHELWKRDEEILKIFDSCEISIVPVLTSSNMDAKQINSQLEVSYLIWQEESSIIVTFKPIISNDTLPLISIDTMLKKIREMVALLKKLIASIKDTIHNSHHRFAL